jgi:soluble lytic murein transglycosylase-like protein
MIYFVLTCLAVYIFLAGAECTAHYFGYLKQPWTRLRFFVGSIGAIILAISTAGWASFIPAPADLPVSPVVKETVLASSVEKETPLLASRVSQSSLLKEASFQILPGEDAQPASKESGDAKDKSEVEETLEETPEIHWYIYHYSNLYGIDPLLVQAVIRVESGFNPRARSKRGAMGLMQINKVTAKHLGLKNPFNVRENIEGGTRYLKKLLKSHYWNVRLALASYNAGPTAVARYKGIPPFRETRRYVWRVLSEYRKLKLVSKIFKEKEVRTSSLGSFRQLEVRGKKATRTSFSPSKANRFRLYN